MGISPDTDERPPFARAPVVALSAAVGVLLIATSGQYGYHRDELYFRLLGQQPAWGYVDQPPGTPLLARLTVELLGDELWALRLPGAFILAGTVILTALLARELGGGRGAQVLAAAGAGLTVFPLVSGHVLLTSTLDLVLTAAILLCLTRALLRDPRWWLAAGMLVGLALYNKSLVVLVLVAIGLGLAILGPRQVLWSRWLLAGVGIALVVGAPNVLYQIAHDWPQLEMARAIERNKGGESRVLLLPLQLVLAGLLLTPVFVAGILHLLRAPRLRPVRALALAYPILLVLVFLTGGQPYYTGGLVLAIFAAGTIPTIRWMTQTRARSVMLGVAVAASVVLAALFALPLLPVSVLAKTPIPDINQATSDQVGWPAYVAQVADVHATLGPQDADGAVIITGNYGEAGALDRFGAEYGLPSVFSGHNELWFRGAPSEEADVAIMVGFSPGFADSAFASCEVVAVLDNGVDIPNEEQGLAVLVCRDPIKPWAELWPSFQHYD